MLAVECRSLTKVFAGRNGKAGGAGGLAGRILARLSGRADEGSRVVDGVDLCVERGEIFGLLGPNGSGKSTLIRIVATLVIPDAGSAKVFGEDVVANPGAVKRLINRVSVEASFFKRLSAWENLGYAAGLYGMPRREARRKAECILESLGMKRNVMEKPIEEMSRGMQQKIAIARALLTSPVLLLLDEPTTGLDPVSKKQVQDFVAEVRRTHDATVMLTTHDMEEAESLCDRIAVIDRGSVIARGTAADLKAQAGLDDGRGATLKDVFMKLVSGDNGDS